MNRGTLIRVGNVLKNNNQQGGRLFFTLKYHLGKLYLHKSCFLIYFLVPNKLPPPSYLFLKNFSYPPGLYKDPPLANFCQL